MIKHLPTHCTTLHLLMPSGEVSFVSSICLLALIPVLAIAQTDTTILEPVAERMLEETAQATLSEDITDNTAFESLDLLSQNQLDLNTCGADELAQLIFLTPLQVEDILWYRSAIGPFISIYELQAVPSLDIFTIKRMLPFVKIETEKNLSKALIKVLSTKGTHQVIARWSSTLERAKGYEKPEDESLSHYLGDPNRYYLRYQYKVGKQLSVGLTAEKDAGEPFFTTGNKQGFDFYSAHFEFKRLIDRGLTYFAFGDYEVNFGQGLIQYHGFGIGKSSLTTNIKRVAPTFEAHNSVNEIDFYRGAAFSYRINPTIIVNGFISGKNRDANLLEPIDSLADDELPDASSIQSSGLHRTANEIADKNSITQTTFGLSVGVHKKHLRVEVNGIMHGFSTSINPQQALYNRYGFRGNSLHNYSISYSWSFRNLHLFGEVATNNFDALASINGMLLNLGKGIETAFAYRNYQKEFVSLSNKVFGESRRPNNEAGFYFGTNVQLDNHFKLNLYHDLWRNFWPSYSSDAPAKGNGLLCRLTYEKGNSILVYVQLKQELKEINLPTDLNTSPTLPRKTLQTRLHLAYKVTESLELRTRIDLGKVSHGPETLKGISIYQDLIYKQLGSPWSLSCRYALFDTPDYDLRFYHYENDVRYSFSIPAYYNSGMRYYLQLRYKIRKGPSVEVRLSKSTFPNLAAIGSSLDEIPGNTKTELKCQLFWKF